MLLGGPGAAAANPHQHLQLSAGRGSFASFWCCCGIEGCFGQWQDRGCAPHPAVCFTVLWEDAPCSATLGFTFIFPKLSTLLFVKQAASYVKVELNLRQVSQG